MTVSFLKGFKVNSNKRAKDAFENFLNIGIPTKKIENWHYTNLNQTLSKKTFDKNSKLTKNKLNINQTIKILIVNGRVVIDEKSIDKKDLEKINISTQKNNFYLDIINEKTNPMAALNTAFYKDCIVIEIAKTILSPIHISFAYGGDNFADFPRVMIDIAKNAKAEIIETFESLNAGELFIDTVVEIRVNQGASLLHYKIQADDSKSTHVSYCAVNVDKDGFYANKNIFLSGLNSRNEINVNLNGELANTLVSGVFLTENTQFVDNTVRINHNRANCNSSQLFKGILKDSSKSVFQGKIYVDREAQKTDGYQMHRAIILSPEASVSCKPELEIYADDVKCSHGATTGEIDKQQLFYMLCRGISEKKARHMLLLAFLGEVFDDIKNDDIKCFIENLVIEKTDYFLK
jgi:Fe-S cluster assembly protein SufD